MKKLLVILACVSVLFASAQDPLKKYELEATKRLKADDKFIWQGDTISKDSIAYVRILGSGDSIQFKMLNGNVSPKYYYIPPTPNDPQNKRLNGSRQWVPTESAGSGGYNANLYFTTINSDISGYRNLLYIPESSETELSASISNGEYLLREYLYPDTLGTSIIDAGEWFSRFRYKISNATGITQLKLELFVYHTNGTTNTLFSTYSDELNETTYTTVDKTSGQPIFNVLNSDRIGVKLYAKTTSLATITIYTIVGDGNGAYIRIPLKPRHDIALRNLQWTKAGHYHTGEALASFGISGQATTKQIGDLTSVNNKITVTSGTDAIIGTGTSLTLNEANIVHQNLSGAGTNTHTQIDNFIASKAQSGGLASLDSGGKVPFSQLPATLMIYKGTWSPLTNTPTLTDGIGTSGWVYKASLSGTVNFGSGNITFYAGDWVIYNGSIWERSVGTDNVVSVNGLQGVVQINPSLSGNILSLTGGTATVNIGSATDVAANTAARHSAVTLGTANGLSLSGQQLSLGLSSTSSTGALSSTDWNTFNSKQTAYTNLTSIGSLTNGSGFLKNNGSGTWSYAFPTYSEVGAAPASGSANYVQNQYDINQPANFRIDGSGRFGSDISSINTSGYGITIHPTTYGDVEIRTDDNSGTSYSSLVFRLGNGSETYQYAGKFNTYGLEVANAVTATQLQSSVATGTAPLSVNSTTMVANLNADLLDGYHASSFQLALTNPITGAGTTGYIPVFTGSGSLGNSPVYSNYTGIAIGSTSIPNGALFSVETSGWAISVNSPSKTNYSGLWFSGDDSNLLLRNNSSDLTIRLNSADGSITASSLAGSGTRVVTASQTGQLGVVSGAGFVKADGSVDNNSYLTSITSSQVTTALGYTPYNSSNPSGYISSYTETDPIFNAHTVKNISNGTGLLRNNGSGTWSYDNALYITSSALSGYATESWVTNRGYLTSYTETDPTIYSWAKASTKPTYTYSEVGAAPSSTVSFPGFGTTHTTAAYGDHTHSQYLTGNQTITLSGVVTGSGTTSIATSIADAALSIAKTNGLQTALDGKLNLTGGTLTGALYGTSVTLTGNLTCAEGYRGNSDIRLKENIKPIEFDASKIDLKQFEFKSDSTNRTHYGVIAQEVEKIAPELVYTDEKGIKSVAYIDLIIAKIAALEKENAELLKRIEKLEKAK